MKILGFSKFISILILATLVCSNACLSEERTKSYSELLKEAVSEAGMYVSGYELLSQIPGPGRWSPVAPPEYIRFVEGLDTKDAIPFLLDVIENGPDWQADEYEGRDNELAPHIARCYAVLCLASTKDAQAYPVLTDLLKSGTFLAAPDMHEETRQKYDIKKYAAAGLGILADDRAVSLLVSALDNSNPQVRYQSMFALAKINDTRAIEPILNAAAKYELDDFSLDSCMKKLTKIKFTTKFHKKKREIEFTAFPELGTVKFNEHPYMAGNGRDKGLKKTTTAMLRGNTKAVPAKK